MLDRALLIWREHALDGRFGELPERELSLFRVTVIEDRRHEVSGMAIRAFDEHGPHLRLAGDHMDVVGMELVVTNHAALHAIEDDLFDFDF